MSGNPSNKKRSKSYYQKCAKKHKNEHGQHLLEGKLQGVLITCNNYEREAVREAYNLLNEYADKLFGPEKLPGDTNSSDDGDQDLENEIAKLKQQQKVERRFQNVLCRVNNCVFIKSNVPDINKLVHTILTDAFETGILKARHILRIVPVIMTCGTSKETIVKTANDIFGSYFRTPLGFSQTFSIIYKARNNSSVSRMDTINDLAMCIGEMNPLNKVHHNEPDLAILVNIVCTVCCISVVRDYKKLRCYNIQEVVESSKSKSDSKVKPETNDGAKAIDDEIPIIEPATNENGEKTEVSNDTLEKLDDTPSNEKVSEDNKTTNENGGKIEVSDKTMETSDDKRSNEIPIIEPVANENGQHTEVTNDTLEKLDDEPCLEGASQETNETSVNTKLADKTIVTSHDKASNKSSNIQTANENAVNSAIE